MATTSQLASALAQPAVNEVREPVSAVSVFEGFGPIGPQIRVSRRSRMAVVAAMSATDRSTAAARIEVMSPLVMVPVSANMPVPS